MGLFGKKQVSSRTAKYADVFRSARERERRHFRHRWQWVLLGVFVVLLGAAGYGVYYYFSLQSDIQVETPEVTPPETREEPFNVLLVGSDSRRGLSPREQLELGAAAVDGQRADTLILAHIDPETSRVTMVQFPRDLWVPISGGGRARINSALEGGRGKLVKTVEDLTGLSINNYIQVNIAGFRNLVDAIKGVEVCVPEPIEFDPKTGIEISPEEVGMVRFDGNRALRFVRSRNFATGDFERIQNQQKFIAAALDKVMSTSTFFQPGRVRALADVARRNVLVDQHTTIRGLVDIGQKLRTFDPNTYEAYTAPNLGSGFVEVDGTELSIVRPDPPAMKRMFAAIQANESPAAADDLPPVDASKIRVGVYNGVGLDKVVAAPARDALREATAGAGGPVDVVEVANAPKFGHRGVKVIYNRDDPKAEAMGELVVAALPGAAVDAGKTRRGVDVAVIVGRGRFETRKLIRLQPIPIPVPGELPAVCRRDSEASN